MSTFLPPNSGSAPTITYNGSTITLPMGSDPADFDEKGFPQTTQTASKSKYVIPWDPGVCDKTAYDAFKMIKGRLTTKKRGNYGYEQGCIPRVKVELPFDSGGGEPRITWLGHATTVVQLNGKLILTDPVFSVRCSPSRYMGPKRYTEPGCTIEELISANVVFDVCVISHDHYDHLDVDSIRALKNIVKKWYVPGGTASVLTGVGVGKEAVKEMVWWEEGEDDSGLTVVCCPAQHWCCRKPWDRNKRLWATWVVKFNNSRFFFGGDTGYPTKFPLFKMIGDLHGPFDVSAIPIGAYHPRWFMAPAHTDPKSAVDIHRDVKSKTSIAIHWGTFPLADELYFAPVSELLEHKGGEDDFVALRIGEGVTSGSKIDCRVGLTRLLELAEEGGR
ncbi:hypothetical protein TL16_g10894 [Triparma laevis f. inornata]|uniref:Metallo-beta-lactamase domain-containing protein n=1 Tax=Triparma laevis f. inornata TaxID=1714386 RepID=A0A9W7BAV3_9STRA|nr:hypothetical protein TL16_g10894 [Triparma laevis f. inornata]